MSTSTQTPPRTYSGLPLEFVCEQVQSHYALPASTRCQLLALGMHENYLVECPGEKFILRVYRPRARALSDIRYELELLEHLDHAGCPVAAPKCQEGVNPVLLLNTPTGDCPAVLFKFAPGTAPGNQLNTAHSETLGRAVAQVHNAADNFQPQHTRQTLDLGYLLDASVVAIDPWLTSGQRSLVQNIQQRLHRALPPLPRTAPWFGPCHGDINPRNVHFDAHGRPTLFDFDQCGPGWRAFEIGKFYASLLSHAARADLRAAFERGYGSVRPLSTEEQHALPGFMLVSPLWVMALHVYNVDITAPLLADSGFWSRMLDRLQQLEAECARELV